LIALDNGLRKNEALSLQWNDLDFENNHIRLRATNTKTEREKIAPLTERTKTELFKLKDLNEDTMIFPFKDFKRSFAIAKKIAQIEDLQNRDLRRTAITRWQELGVVMWIAGKLAGHAKPQTTMKHYTATDIDMVRDISEMLNESHSNQNLLNETPSEMPN